MKNYWLERRESFIQDLINDQPDPEALAIWWATQVADAELDERTDDEAEATH